MTARMRAMMGELMPDEMLKKYVTDSIDAMFFRETVTVTQNYYGPNKVETTPPYITRFVKANVEETIGKIAREWCDANKEKVEQIVRETIQDGIAKSVTASFSRMWGDALNRLQSNMYEALQQQERLTQA